MDFAQQLNQILVSKWARYLPFVIISLFSLFIIYNLYGLFSQFRVGDKSVEQQQAALKPVQTQQLDISQLPNWHLMGISDSGDANVPDTSLRLTLQGIMQAGDEQKSQAIIIDGSGNAKVYISGDSVPGGAKIHQVLPYSVIINRAGVLEKLELPKTELNFAPPPRTANEVIHTK